MDNAHRILTDEFPVENASTYLQFLESQLDRAWRPTEWDPEAWHFAGDPANPLTAAYPCTTPDCTGISRSATGRCETCKYEGRAAVTAGQPRLRHARMPDRITRCTVVYQGKPCRALESHHSLCYHHYQAWRKRCLAASSEIPLEIYRRDALRAFPKGGRCHLPRCDFEQWRHGETMCLSHHFLWRRLRRQGVTLQQFLAVPRKVQNQWKGNEFCLVDLPPVLRLEFLLILQQRDRQGYRIDPRVVRPCLTIALETRIRTMEALHQQVLEGGKPRRLELGLTNYGRLSAARWRYRFSGHDMRHEDVWDAAVLELRVDRTTQRRCSKGIIDFTPVTIDWLRHAAKQYAATLELPADQVRELVRACTIASQALLKRPNGPRPGRLQREDARAVFDAYANSTAPDGTARTKRFRHDMFHVFKRLLSEGRELPALHGLAPAFRFLTADQLDKPEKPDPTSKAIPDSVIRILDNNIHLLSVTAESPYAMGRPPELHSRMLQAIYQLLRDLGRRPTEVLALKRDALHHSDDGQPFIRYDAPKTGDYGLELPIHTSTAAVIEDWTTRINAVADIHPDAAQYLFPSLSGFGPGARSHISLTGFHTHYWRWIDRIKELPDYVNGPEGTIRYFERGKLNLYAWRHTYAQRLSDNHTPPDVIKDLMNHKRFETSAGYILMNRKRKEEAIRIVSTTTVNRDGTATAPGEYAAYLRNSVATPLGLCTEPSNVKAGGQACPARSKCGGCSYFRANVSHLPVIDSHIVALTADLELAAPLAEDWIIEGINAEIASYKRIRRLLTQTKNSLTTEQQAEIDQATELLQNLAAAPTTIGHRNGLKLLPLTPKQR